MKNAWSPAFAVLAALSLVGQGDTRPAGADEKLLASFEEDEVRKMVDGLKLERKESRDKDGRPYVSISKPYFLNPPWNLFKGQASHGEYALGVHAAQDPEKLWFATKVEIPPAAAHYYGLTNAGHVFNTCGVFRRIFAFDWSEYDLLRVDVYAEAAKQTVRLALEDEEIAPPVVRTVSVEPGKWTCFEVDLRAAARARGLDLRRMATLTIGVVDAEAKGRRPYAALIDNLRLARQGAPAAHPVVRDESSHDLPDYYRATSQPEPEKIPGAPDRAPLAAERPIVIPTEKTSAVNPVGWIAAHDNRHMLAGFLENDSVPPTKVLMLQTRDGGRSWKGLDGGANPSSFWIVGSNHGGGRGDVVGMRPDAVVLTNLGCRGGSWASLRLFAQKVTFTGQGWEIRERPTLVDCDLRHCNSNQSVIRTPDGRLWAAYGLAGRLTSVALNVRYSDDDGVTWKSWAEGKSGALPGLEKPAIDGWTYQFDEPCLVPFGKGIACLWQDNAAPRKGELRWSRLESGAWTPIETIPPPKAISQNPTARPPVSAVSVRGEEIFLVGSRFQGVLHYRAGKWTLEAEDVPRAAKIAVAGDKVVVVAAVTESGDPYKGPVTLKAWRRLPEGKWAGPESLATEELPLSNRQGGDRYLYRPGFVLQPYAPPNFVPLAWTCEGEKWIKVLRIPVGP